MKGYMKKSLLRFLLLALSVCALTLGLALTACGKKPDLNPVDEDIVIKLSDTVVSVSEYESVQLTAKVTGSAKEVVWSSSDQSVATVVNGEIYAVGEGTATITAKVSNTTASCTVTVTRTPYAPKILVTREITLETGASFVNQARTEWNKQLYSGAVDYTWTFGENSPSDVVSFVKGENGKATFTALRKGDAEVYVSATVHGIYTNSKIIVHVVDAAVSFFTEEPLIAPGVGKFETELATLPGEGYSDCVALSFDLSIGTAYTENVPLTWSVDNGTVAEVRTENGKQYLYALDEGEAEVTGTYDNAGSPVTVTVHATVIKPVFRLTEHAVFEVEDLKPYTVTGEILGNVVGARLYGTDVFASGSGKTFNLKKSALPKASKQLGEQTLTVVTEQACYEMDVTLYTLIIHDADELDSMVTIARSNGPSVAQPDGYFILGNDIDYNRTYTSMVTTGDAWAVARDEGDKWNNFVRYGFRGIFDGMGYNIDGMTIAYANNQSGGFIGYMNGESTVRNVSFTNAVLTENSGMISSVGDGLIENVYVKFKKIGSPEIATTNLTSDPRKMGAFFSYYKGESAVVKNCVVDAMDAEIDYEEAGGKNNLALGTLAYKKENLLVLCPTEKYLNASGGSHLYKTYAALIADTAAVNALTSGSSVWKNVNGIPLFAAVKNANDISVTVTADRTTVYVGNSAKLSFNADYITVEVSSLPSGVTYANGVLSAANGATPGTVTVSVRSILNNSSDSITITVADLHRETISAPRREIDLKVSLNGAAASVGATGTQSFDLSSRYSGSASSAKLEIGGTQIADVPLSGGIASVNLAAIPANKYGECTFDFIVSDGSGHYCYSYPVLLVTKVILNNTSGSSAGFGDANFRAIGQIADALEGGGYYKLGETINIKWNFFVLTDSVREDFRIGVNHSFVGTLDGDGHCVNGLNAVTNKGQGGIIQTLGAEGVVKNIGFTNVNAGGQTSIIAGGSGRVENVYVHYKVFGSSGTVYNTNWVWGSPTGTTVFGANVGDITLKNVAVDFSDCTGFHADGNRTPVAIGTLGANASVESVAVFGLRSALDDRVLSVNSSLGNGSAKGIFVKYTDGTDNGVAFPGTGWNAYWSVDNTNKTIGFVSNT